MSRLWFTVQRYAYAFMQATGMVNDHTVECFRYPEIVKSGGLKAAR